MKECVFCKKFGYEITKNNIRKWYDELIIESNNFVVVPALGQIIPGYLLLIPKLHISSISQLNHQLRNEMCEVLLKVMKMQSACWSRPIIFEHGSSPNEMSSGASIEHAHWHLVPGNWNLVPSQSNSVHLILSIDEFFSYFYNSETYLLISDFDMKLHILLNERVPSQYFRRNLAFAMGKPNKWNYLKYPFTSNIKKTYEKIETFKSEILST